MVGIATLLSCQRVSVGIARDFAIPRSAGSRELSGRGGFRLSGHSHLQKLPPMNESKILPLLTWRSAICESDLPPTARHVALTLSLWMNERGASAFPGLTNMVNATGLSRRAVQMNLRLLVDTGWLELVEQGGKRGEERKANHYRAMNPGSTFTGASSSPVHLTTTTGASDDADGCSTFAPSLQDLSKNSSTFENAFNEIWSKYPRKEARLVALKAYTARRRAGVSHEELAKAVGNFIPAMAKRDRDNILLGATFFGPDERWKDYLLPVSNGEGPIDTDAYFKQFKP